MPLGLYRLYVAGLSRQAIFTGYAVACVLSSLLLAWCWAGRAGARLRAANASEEAANTEAPRLHGLTVRQQLWSVESLGEGQRLGQQALAEQLT